MKGRYPRAARSLMLQNFEVFSKAEGELLGFPRGKNEDLWAGKRYRDESERIAKSLAAGL